MAEGLQSHLLQRNSPESRQPSDLGFGKFSDFAIVLGCMKGAIALEFAGRPFSTRFYPISRHGAGGQPTGPDTGFPPFLKLPAQFAGFAGPEGVFRLDILAPADINFLIRRVSSQSGNEWEKQ
jgi:hypothetical protein